MLKWALIFFIVSIIAGVFGFTGIANEQALSIRSRDIVPRGRNGCRPRSIHDLYSFAPCLRS